MRPRVFRFAPAEARTHLAEPAWLSEWRSAYECQAFTSAVDLVTALRRSRPVMIVLDAREAADVPEVCRRCKRDAYAALVPCVVLIQPNNPGGDLSDTAALFEAGADEVLDVGLAAAEARARLDAAVRRSVRDLAAQPTTGLPGPPAIDAELERRLRDGGAFAACYADLDHFKEYNDRYGFGEGDRVIRMVARLLYDVAVGTAGDEAFVGHIGGDDFLCVLPLDVAAEACTLIVDTFDLLAPVQYNAADRRAGYYLGKDRRGQLHRVPLMTLSLGVATTERRRYDSASEVSRLASEMKSFAKTLPGSVFAFDRRGDDSDPAPAPFAETE